MSNIFLFHDRVIKTPSKESGLLPGITREVVLELVSEADMEARECDIATDELYQADEVFLTNSVMEIMPLVELDGKVLGSGFQGPVTRTLRELYREYVATSTTTE